PLAIGNPCVAATPATTHRLATPRCHPVETLRRFAEPGSDPESRWQTEARAGDRTSPLRFAPAGRLTLCALVFFPIPRLERPTGMSRRPLPALPTLRTPTTDAPGMRHHQRHGDFDPIPPRSYRNAGVAGPASGKGLRGPNDLVSPCPL